MIQYLNGDLFASPARVIVNTVNTDGVMGKGIALEFKKRYTEMFELYKKACDSQSLKIGKLLLWYGVDHWVLSFPTKEHWRGNSKIEYIEKGLETFKNKYRYYNISSIAFPKLGCGNGGLDWEDVKPVMEKHLKDLPIDVYVYLDEYRQNGSKTIKKSESADTSDFTFGSFIDYLSENCTLVPMQIDDDWKVKWNYKDGVVFSDSDNEICISNEDLFKIWDEIMRKQIVVNTDDLSRNLIYRLLYFLKYLNPAQIHSENGEIVEGFQLDEGRGRLNMMCNV